VRGLGVELEFVGINRGDDSIRIHQLVNLLAHDAGERQHVVSVKPFPLHAGDVDRRLNPSEAGVSPAITKY